MSNTAILIITILGYSICMAFICGLQKQINAIHKDLREQFNILSDKILKINIKNGDRSNNNPPDKTK